MVRVSKLKVKNFRSLAEIEIPLHKYTILIGRNNSGKSSVLLAIKLLFEGTTRDLADSDFYASGTKLADEIVIEAELEGVDKDASQISRYIYDSDEESKKGKLRIRRRVCRSRLSLGKPELRKLELWDPTKKDDEENAWELPTGIENALKQFLPEIIFIEAFKDPSEEAQAKSSATFGKILKKIVERVSAQLEADIKGSLEQAYRRLNVVENQGAVIDERPEELKWVEQQIKHHMRTVFEEADVRLKFHLPDMRDLIGSATIELRDRGVWTPLEGKGQGFQRVLYLSLLQTLAEKLPTEGGIGRPFLLLFEEPEAFLHPALQRKMGDTLESISESNQVVISTHSPLLVTPRSIKNVIILKRDSNYRTIPCVPDFNKIPNQDDKQLASLLSFSHSAEFLFADCVLVVEGPSDRTLLEACWYVLRKNQASGKPPVDLAIVEAGSKEVVPVWIKYLQTIGLPARGIVDLDFLWDGAGKCLGADPDLSQFVQELWKLAEQEGIKLHEEKTIRPDKKSDAFKLIMRDLREQALTLHKRLRNEARIWVLLQGEIENYFGLSSSSKGKYASVAQQIRKNEIQIPSEIEDALKWGAGLE